MEPRNNNFAALVGNTPLLELRRFAEGLHLGSRIFAKIEYLNPAGSIKDRAAWGIIREAEESGRLKPGQRIVDLTSGNTGIGLAALAAARGYRSKFYLRNTISEDKIKLLQHYGAEVVLIDNSAFLEAGAIHTIIDRVRRENPDAYYTNQRANPANPRVHFETTGPEIWRDTKGEVDIFVAAVGTGGTISGTGSFLKAQKPGVKVVVVEPGPASIPSPEAPYPDSIEGVHKVTDVEAGYLPENFDAAVVDEVIVTDTAPAREVARTLAQQEGILAGTSSGAVLFAASALARRPENAGKTIVAIVADSGERYLSPPKLGPAIPEARTERTTSSLDVAAAF
ncbi:PLP-dependent cysteine synthase family protein [Bosea sp. NBC_00550]|uniref:PLP-dependent cysteine synthase family protein n=1 Tax=Bosea sp. NBC_00550 TaxID=2969621 RepID=UPI00222F46B0|nr:cysteine synthase family protein [Bosea sp. NBC_00550]UZF93409.1 cysteine synthase family protein [Bosea sp. NBC_00550]